MPYVGIGKYGTMAEALSDYANKQRADAQKNLEDARRWSTNTWRHSGDFAEVGTDEALEDAGRTFEGAGTALGGAVLHGLDMAATGISSSADLFVGSPLKALGWENNPISQINEKLQGEKAGNDAHFTEALKDKGGGMKALYDVGSDVVSAIPQAVLAYLTGGLSLAAPVGTAALNTVSALHTAANAGTLGQAIKVGIETMVKNPNYWLSFAQSSGDSYEAAKQDGASELRASAFATINGLLNSLVEVGGGGIQELPAALKGGKAPAVRQWVDTMLDEGKEEAVQGVIERLLQNVTYNKGNPIYSSTDPNAVINLVTSAKEAGMGALVGGILGGGQIGANSLINGRGAKAQPAEVINPETLRGKEAKRPKSNVELFVEAARMPLREPPTSSPKDSVELFLEAAGLSPRKAPVIAQESADVRGAAVEGESEQSAQANFETARTAEQKPVLTTTAQKDIVSPTEDRTTRDSSTGAATAGFVAEADAENQLRYERALDDYGAIPLGENPRGNNRAVPVPAKTDEGNVPLTVRTAMEANVTPGETAAEIASKVAKGELSRAVITDKAAGARAKKTFDDKGWDTALSDWTSNVRSGKVGKDNVALGFELYNHAANAGNANAAVNILTDLVDSVRSGAQAVQAVRLLKRMSPEHQLYGVQRSVRNLQDELTARHGDKAPTLKIDPELVRTFLEAETETERKAAMGEIYQDIADQTPSNWQDKLNAWRYMSMLANPKTHVRNIAGNLAFMPVRMVKNLVGAGIESTAIGKNGARTKAVLTLSADDRARMQAGWADYAGVVDIIQSGGKYDSDANEIRDRQRIFKSTALETVRKANSFALDAEDTWFSRPTYAASLAGFLKANGVTAGEYMSPDFDKTAAQAYAIKEAQKATYRDFNEFSDFISKLGKDYSGDNKVAKVVNAGVEGVLPFKRTPANILVRGVEYSPLGLARGVWNATTGIKSGKVTAAEAIDQIAAGLTGSALVGLGVLLAKLGLVTGGGGEDDKLNEFDKLGGAQNYAVNVGDKSYTLDWLAPEALPFFVGVEFHNSIIASGKVETKDVYAAITRIAEPLLEMSMLSGVNDALDGISYAESNDKLWAFAASAAFGYLSQFIPTIGGQLERTFFEDTRQTSFTNRDSAIPGDIQYAISKAANKIPGIEYNQTEYIDAWGRKQSTGTPEERAFNNFINPAYVSERRETPADGELRRLYEKGFDGVFPKRVPPSQKVDGEYLTKEQYEEYATTKGQTSLDVISAFVGIPEYKKMPDDERAKAIDIIYEYSREIAAKKAADSKIDSAWIRAISAQPPDKIAEYAAYKAITASAESDEKGAQKALSAGIDPDIVVGGVSPAVKDDWDKIIKPAKISAADYLVACYYHNNIGADKDANGKPISGSAKAKVLEKINKLRYTSEQKDAMYRAIGYGEKDIGKALWNAG